MPLAVPSLSFFFCPLFFCAAMPQYVMTEPSLPGFQPTRKMESFAGPWPTPPMRRLLRAQRRQEGWHVHHPLPSQKPGSRFIQTAAPDEASTRLSFSRKQADGGKAGGDDKRRHRLAKMDPARPDNSDNKNSVNTNTNIIGSACVALISSVGKTVADVTNFIRRCRSARADLSAVTRELSELQMVLELLNDYGQCNDNDGGDGDKRRTVPLTLQAHLRPILTNCTTVVLRIDGVLQRHGEDEGPPKWTLDGRKEINDLHNSLEVHRGALGLVSDLIPITLAREARAEGATREPQGEQLQLRDVIEDLQTVLSSILVSDSNATLARQHFALQVHLGQIIAYAQTLDKADAWEEAVKTIDATPDKTHSGTLQPPPEPVSPIASSRGRRSFDSDGTVEGRDAPKQGVEPVSPMESRETISMDKREDTALTISRNESRRVPRLDIPGSSTNTARAPAKDSNSVSPMTCREPTVMKRPIDKLKHAEQDLDAISPLTLGRPLSLKAVGEPPMTTETTSEDPQDVGSDDRTVTDDSIAPVAIRRQSGVAASQASTAESSYEEGEITEEALAFAQVPVHILGRLSLNLVGHVYTNKSGLSGGSDGTSFNRSISTTETAEEMGEAEAEGYAHSTATSDTGSLRDGHLQFSQMDVTQMPAQEPPRREKSHNVQQPMAPQQPPTSYQMMHQEPSHEIREQQSISTMNTHNFLHGKPLPRPPLVFIPNYPGPCARKKVVVVGNFSCGKTCLIT